MKGTRQVICVVVMLGSVGAVWARMNLFDPTKPPDALLEAERAVVDGQGAEVAPVLLAPVNGDKPKLPPPQVTVAMVRPSGQTGLALLDGEWRKVGDDVQGWRVANIDSVGVYFEVNDQKHMVRVLPLASKNTPIMTESGQVVPVKQYRR